jgi:predicted methyltransferase
MIAANPGCIDFEENQVQLFAARTSTLVAAALFTAFLGWAHADGHGDRLAAALDAQSDGMKARYQYRHPAETLTFFGIKPGMTVVEVLPGGGWYSKILMPYLGPDGTLIGADYNVEIYRHLGFWSEEELAAKKTWVQDWPKRASKWAGDDGAPAQAFVMGKMPESFKGSADAVLLIRMLHNPQRVRSKSDADYTSEILQDTFDVLKPGGTVGVVQHQASEDKADEWANGRRGYLKKSWVIARLEAAGFEYVGASDINTNPKDQPGADASVWRLPPSLYGSRNNPELRKKYRAIGESNRMTLKFIKPE